MKDTENKNNFPNLEGYNSSIEDIAGGIEYREMQTGKEMDKNWMHYPGEDSVSGDRGAKAANTISYPMMLLTFSTKMVLNKLTELLDINKITNSDLFKEIDNKYIIKVDFYKTWDDGSATFIGTGILNHDRWVELDEMGLNPILYLKKGDCKKVSSGVIFNYDKFNPIILQDSSQDENKLIVKSKEKTTDTNNLLTAESEINKIKKDLNKVEPVSSLPETETISEEELENMLENINWETEKQDNNINHEDDAENEYEDKEENIYSSLIPDLEWNSKNE